MNIEGSLVDYLKERSGVAVGPDTLLIEEKIIDSMGVVELLAFIEETFGVEVDLEDLTIEKRGWGRCDGVVFASASDPDYQAYEKYRYFPGLTYRQGQAPVHASAADAPARSRHRRLTRP